MAAMVRFVPAFAGGRSEVVEPFDLLGAQLDAIGGGVLLDAGDPLGAGDRAMSLPWASSQANVSRPQTEPIPAATRNVHLDNATSGATFTRSVPPSPGQDTTVGCLVQLKIATDAPRLRGFAT
jgi:hypothetical protein